MDRKELLTAYTKRFWMANTANDITGLLLDYEKDLKLIEEREQVKNCSTPNVVGQNEQCSGCEESTGETKLWCCNHCGKRVEDF